MFKEISTLKAKKYSLSARILLLLLLLALQGCDGLLGKKEPEIAIPETIVQPSPASAKAIIKPAKNDIRFAQTALKKLNYAVGQIDGIWGPKSARAIRQFEQDNSLVSANGHLSELNLRTLSQLSKTSRIQKSTPTQAARSRGIVSKLDRSIPLSQAPQLIIVDRSYSLLAKPNPYSEPLLVVSPGSGIYVVSVQDGWYEVVVENQIRGYIKD